MFENLHKISLISIEKAPVTQPNIYSLEVTNECMCVSMLVGRCEFEKEDFQIVVDLEVMVTGC